MDKSRRSISLGFTSEPWQEGTHICYIFTNEMERLQVISKYLRAGRFDNDKLLYLVDMMTPKQITECFAELGVEARTKGDLTVSEAGPTYHPAGVFHADEMLDLLKDFYLTAVNQEMYAGARAAGEMTWCLKGGVADEEELLAYEARLNPLLEEYPLTACCQYDAARFSGQMIIDVLAVHPAAIIHGQLVKNPYAIKPEEFLREYRARAAGSRA